VPKPHGRIVEGEILFKGRDLRTLDRDEMRQLRGNRIAMIFQDPLSALNPVFTVGFQVAEVFRAHLGMGKREAGERAIGLLELVGIPQPRQRARDYPHQFSGGMRQRVMIAMAVALNPDLLVADEPTTALDVTIQAQILDVLLKVKEESGGPGAAIVLITHDLGVVAGVADRVMVMYAGRAAEVGPCDEIYRCPRHPYTWGLMTSITRLDRERRDRLVPIAGSPPSLIHVPPGCPFWPRCPHAEDVCRTEVPQLRRAGPSDPQGGPALPGEAEDGRHLAACHFADRPDWKPPAELVAGGSGGGAAPRRTEPPSPEAADPPRSVEGSGGGAAPRRTEPPSPEAADPPRSVEGSGGGPA
jgi:oligopeptide/dipeptide ABC transporter ATP-binding protein